jgi:DNA-binding NtrC family response regulator
VPSLRDRREDIPQLVQHLVERHSRTLRRRIDVIPTAVIHALESYDWPGNVRELENVIQRAIILSTGHTLELKDAWLPSTDMSASGGGTTLVEVERRHILHILEACRWRIEGAGGAAQVLAMRASTLRSRMLKLGIARPR